MSNPAVFVFDFDGDTHQRVTAPVVVADGFDSTRSVLPVMVVKHHTLGSTATNDKHVTLPPSVKAAVKTLNIDFAQMTRVLSSPLTVVVFN